VAAARSGVTGLLAAVQGGNEAEVNQLIPLVYESSSARKAPHGGPVAGATPRVGGPFNEAYSN
jgi:hypothetical protein